MSERTGGCSWRLMALVLAVAVMLACVGPAVVYYLMTGTMTSRPERPIVERAYPGFHVVDGWRKGYILRSDLHPDVSIVVGFSNPSEHPARDGQPTEFLTRDWQTDDTFFLHGTGRTPDPRTGMTYDVDGFAAEYAHRRPSAVSLINGVWLDRTEAGVEYYVVLVASRVDPHEMIWPDRRAVFTRAAKTGQWSGGQFAAAQIPNRVSQ